MSVTGDGAVAQSRDDGSGSPNRGLPGNPGTENVRKQPILTTSPRDRADRTAPTGPRRHGANGSEVDQAERDALGHAVGLVRRIELAQRLLDEAFDGFRRNPQDLRRIRDRLAAGGPGQDLLFTGVN